MDNLVEHILTFRQSYEGGNIFCSVVFVLYERVVVVVPASGLKVICPLVSDCESREDSDHLISSLTTLYLFCKIRAQLLVKHAVALQPYLATQCHVRNQTYCAFSCELPLMP